MAEGFDVKKHMTDKLAEKFLASLEKGQIPWEKPWQGGGRDKSILTGKPYRGINTLLLLLHKIENPDCQSEYWVTQNFVRKNNKKFRIKKGAKLCQLVKYFVKKENIVDDKGEEKEVTKYAKMRYFYVINLSQIEGEGVEKYQNSVTEETNPIENCEKIIQGYKTCPKIHENGDKAFYSPKDDYIVVPPKNAFKSVESFYSTLFHEMGHSTGHSNRLKRKGIENFDYFGSHQYAEEELVAELTASLLCGHTSINSRELEDNSVAYIQSWIKIIKEKPNVLWDASKNAVNAYEYILGGFQDGVKDFGGDTKSEEE